MARPKKQVKLKEPIKIRLKPLADGNKSIYLDIYWKGVRKYEYLKLYIIPEVNPLCKEQNKETMALAERIKAERIKALHGHGVQDWETVKQGSQLLTGQIKALVSYPGYDNNKLANGVDADYYESLRDDKSNPLWNYATQEKTAPGSTFKLVTSTAGLAEGVIDTSSVIDCTGIFHEVSNEPKCWIYPGAHGNFKCFRSDKGFL